MEQIESSGGVICPPITEETATTTENGAKCWESADFTVSKVIKVVGNPHVELPRFGATCQLRITQLQCSGISLEALTGDFFYSKYFNAVHSGEIQIGNADSEVDRTLEKCVQSMHSGEKSFVTLRTLFDIQKNKRDKVSTADVWIEVNCQIFLESLLNAQPIHKWYPETKLDKAKEINLGAVRLFKTQRYLDAFRKFQVTLKLLTFIMEEVKEVETDEDRENLLAQAEDLSLTCYSNIAACQFQWNNFKLVIDLTSKVLEKQPDNVKLLYRRGVAYLERKEFEESKADLVEAHRLDPSNKAINEKLGQLRVQEKKHKEQLANGMKKMFG